MMAMVFVAGLALAACSSGGGDNNPTTSGGGSTSGGSTSGGGATSAGSNCSDVTAQGDFQVTMKNFAFDPKCIIAKNTQKADFENQDSATHTFTIDNTPIDVTMAPGSQQELDAPGDSLPPGKYIFYCRFHGHPDGTGMAGTITIK
jgi:plastocyanin